MPEIKNQFTGGKMNKDVDERLVPKGEYRNAMNIQVSTSEGSDVGTVQNILGNIEGCNTLLMDMVLPSASSFAVGSIADEANDSLYWLVSGQPFNLSNATQYIDDWGQFSALSDVIIRKRPSIYDGYPDRCEPVFVDKYAFTTPIVFGASTGVYLSGLPTSLTSQIEPGWTVAGITNTGGFSNTVDVSSIQESTPITVHAGSSPDSLGGGFNVELQTSPSGAVSMSAHSNLLYIAFPQTGLSLGDLAGLTVDLFGVGHLDYQTNTIQSASYVTITFAGGYSATTLKLIMLNNLVPFSDPSSFDVNFLAGGNALGGSYQGSMIWGALIHTTPAITLPIPMNIIYDANASGSVAVGDPITFGNGNGCVGELPWNGLAFAFSVVDCNGLDDSNLTTGLSNANGDYLDLVPVAIPSGSFSITLPLLTQVLLDSTLNLTSSHETFVFSKPRVLNFNHNEYVTGINIIDDMLFWTDGKTEPKKINISRSVEGTHEFGQEHTRLINKSQGINVASNILAKEEHITVIRKAPLKAPFLEVSSSTREGVTSGDDVIADGMVGSDFVFNNKDVGDQATITMPYESANPGASFDFKVGDILRLAVGVDDLPEDYELRVSIEAIELDDINFESTYTVKIQTTTSSGHLSTQQEWFVGLEEINSLFERKLPRFAYRYRYEDNEYSSFSPFTEVAFVPGEFNYEPIKAYNKGMTNQIKSLTIKDFITTTIPLDVVQVDILYKNEVSPAIYLLKSISPTDNKLPGETKNNWNSVGSTDHPDADKGAYKISSENISQTLSSSQGLRAWDNVPKKAKAQEVTGNRIVYGNYEIGYDVIQPQITASLGSRFLDAGDYTGRKSIKSLRDYDIGVVWGDKYGRETPVKTAGNSVTVGKLFSDNSSYLKAKLKNSPGWADYYRFYIKETSNEYYNLAMDRMYDADDGNVWLSFPSVDRNKVDEDTYIILKKGADSSELVLEEARYKIVAIENEAPEYIKTTYQRLLRTNTDNSRPSKSCNLWGGANGGTCTFLNAGKNAPTVGRKGFSINADRWSERDFSVVTEIGMMLTSPKVLLDEVSGNTSGSTTDELYVSFSREAGAITPSKKYHVISVDETISGIDNGDYYYINLGEQIDISDEWVTSYVDPVTGNSMWEDDIHVHFWKKTIINKPEFDGRFFVKILNNQTAKTHLKPKGLAVDKHLMVAASTSLYKIADPTLSVTSGAKYNFTTTLSNTAAAAACETNARFEWELNSGSALLEFGTGNISSRWFIDNATFASRQLGSINPSNGNISHQNVQQKFIDPNGDERSSYDSTSNINQEYHCSSCSGFSAPTLNHTNTRGDGYSNGQVGMKGVHVKGTDKYIDISYSKLGPDGYAVGKNGYTKNDEVEWRVGDGGNPYTDDEIKVVGGLKEGERFRIAGSLVVYKILGTQKFRLFNYHGKNTSEGWGFSYPPSWAGNNASRELIAAACDDFWNDEHRSQTVRMQRQTNRRLTYRIRYEVDLEFSPAGTIVTAIDDTNEPYDDISNTASKTMEFLTEYTAEGDNPISANPAIFETEPKEDVDIDIYYEASSSIPTFPLTNKNKYSFIPIGSTLATSSSTLPSTFPEGVFITGFGNINPFNPVYEIYLSMSLTDDDYQAMASQSINYVEKDNGEIVAFKITDPIMDGTVVSGFKIIPKQEVGLSWFNCWSFTNGVESNRIGDTYNKPYVTSGATASSSTEELSEVEVREYGLIYSGIYNSTSSVNNLNQFIAAEKITKDINPIYGSIQKLHAGWGQGGDLVALCEDRILKILANKDALFNADGNANVTSTNLVLGTAMPYSGEYGISKNPESFASEAYRIYFTDKVRGTVMRLSMDGLTPISSHGMRDWFKDNLKLSSKLIGSYDDKKEEYNITLKRQEQDSNANNYDPNAIDKTVTFREDAKGWVSFKSFTPENAISCANEYYTFNHGRLWKHHVEQRNAIQGETNRNTFYGSFSSMDYSTVNVILNDYPGSVKSFNTINYEGSNSRVVVDLTEQSQYYNLHENPGWYVDSLITNKESGSLEEFIEKEGKWFNYIKGQAVQHHGTNRLLIEPDGSSSFDQASFAIQGLGGLNSNPQIVNVLGCTYSLAFNFNSSAQVDDGSCIPFIYGCIEADANNYDSSANTDSHQCYWQGCSCDPVAYPDGCTNTTIFSSAATNYTTQSQSSLGMTGILDDGSCIGIVYGCTNGFAMTNYNPLANVDDGSCVFTIAGCFAPSANPQPDNANNLVNFDNGTCIWSGCDDSSALNYGAGGSGFWPFNYPVDTPFGQSIVQGGYTPLTSAYGLQATTCTYPVQDGCTDSWAFNYWSAATNDDGSCDYCDWMNGGNNNNVNIFSGSVVIPESVSGANDGQVGVVVASGIFSQEASVSIVNDSGVIIDTISNPGPYEFTGLASGDYHFIVTQDTAGVDSILVGNQTTACVFNSLNNVYGLTYVLTVPAGPQPVTGCMDSTAVNYDNTAATSTPLTCEYCNTSSDGTNETFTITSTTDTGIEISWNRPDDQGTPPLFAYTQSWNIWVLDAATGNQVILDSVVNNNLAAGTTITRSYTGLNPSTDYQVNLYSFCGGGFTGDTLVLTTTTTASIIGCTDSSASNYNPSATSDDGSCIQPGVMIGDNVGGGIVFYILQPSDTGYDANQVHGLIAALPGNDLAGLWGCTGSSLPGAQGANVGTGKQNTIDILAGCSDSGIAAEVANNFVEGIYDDWFLPSLNEAIEMMLNISTVASGTNSDGVSVNNIGGFNSGTWIWSSTEIGASHVYSVDNGGNSVTNNVKHSSQPTTRPVRSF